MNGHAPSQREAGTAAELRKKAGLWLRQKRESAGLSQRELANLVGIDYYTFISQIEAGRGKVPAERFASYAKALNVPPREFATTMLRYNEPHIFAMIFGPSDEATGEQDIAALESRLSALEAKLRD